MTCSRNFAILILFQFLVFSTGHLTGQVDECCCLAETLYNTNQKINPILRQLKDQLYFRIFKVKLDAECPFWAMEKMCMQNDCSICTCDAKGLPVPWIEDVTDKANVRDEDPFSVWYDLYQSKSWIYSDEPDTYVDISDNRESYTYYEGKDIWAVIYSENCFQGDEIDSCTEARVMYKMISGLHTNINVHITYNFYDKKKPNYELMKKRVLVHEDRIRNMYFVYSMLLRAVNLASDSIINFNYTTGDKKEDEKTQILVKQLLETSTQNCNQPFKEEELFADSSDIKEQFRNHFYNISRIVDCVGCQKCRLHFRLQIVGLGTALRLLFDKTTQISRNELVVTINIQGLINTLIKVSEAIRIVEEAQVKLYFEQQNEEKIEAKNDTKEKLDTTEEPWYYSQMIQIFGISVFVFCICSQLAYQILDAAARSYKKKHKTEKLE